MSEIRIGHDQISLRIYDLNFDKSALIIRAEGYVDPKKSVKITGDQPVVIVCDDGSIHGTWHADFTECWKPARENPAEHINYVQRLESWGITAKEKK